MKWSFAIVCLVVSQSACSLAQIHTGASPASYRPRSVTEVHRAARPDVSVIRTDDRWIPVSSRGPRDTESAVAWSAGAETARDLVRWGYVTWQIATVIHAMGSINFAGSITFPDEAWW